MNNVVNLNRQMILCGNFNELKRLISNFDEVKSCDADSVEKIITDLAYKTVSEFEGLMRFYEKNDPENFKKLGRMAHREFLPFLLTTETAARFYNKPKGYAGDYLTIDYIYENRVGGVSKSGRMIDSILLSYPQAQAVRNRRHVLSRKIKSIFTHSELNCARITSLACGPAREIFDVVEENPLTSSVEFTLLDLDQDALDLVVARLSSLTTLAKFEIIKANLLNLITGRQVLNIPAQDLIYSIGLIDYFDDKFVVRLLNWIYDNLNSGGEVILGNFHVENPAKSFMDYIFEWKLIHRSESDMDRLFSQSLFGGCSDIFLEEAGVNMFAVGVKK